MEKIMSEWKELVERILIARKKKNLREPAIKGDGDARNISLRKEQELHDRGAKDPIKEDEEIIDEHIVRTRHGYELKAKSTGRNLGKFSSRSAAAKREGQIKGFEAHGGKHW